MECNYKLLKSHKVKPNNPNFDWLEKNYPGFLHTIFMQGIHAGVYESYKLHPFAYKVGYSFNSANKKGATEMDWFWDARELARVRRLFIKKSEKNLNFFLRVYRRWQKDHQKNILAYRWAEKIDFRKLPDQKLYREYEKLYQANIKQGATGYLADCCLSVGAEDWLTEFIKSRVGQVKNLAQIIVILTQPAIPTYVSEEEIALFKIRQKIKGHWKSYDAFLKHLKQDKKLWLQLERHAGKYYWLENNYFAKVLKTGYFAKKLFDQLKGSFAGHNPLTVLNINKRKKDKWLKQLNDRWLANVIQFSSLATHM